MQLRIVINLDNAAFEDEGADALADILEDVAVLVPEPFAPQAPKPLRDSNGNRVGTVEVVA